MYCNHMLHDYNAGVNEEETVLCYVFLIWWIIWWMKICRDRFYTLLCFCCIAGEFQNSKLAALQKVLQSDFCTAVREVYEHVYETVDISGSPEVRANATAKVYITECICLICVNFYLKNVIISYWTLIIQSIIHLLSDIICFSMKLIVSNHVRSDWI